MSETTRVMRSPTPSTESATRPYCSDQLQELLGSEETLVAQPVLQVNTRDRRPSRRIWIGTAIAAAVAAPVGWLWAPDPPPRNAASAPSGHMEARSPHGATRVASTGGSAEGPPRPIERPTTETGAEHRVASADGAERPVGDDEERVGPAVARLMNGDYEGARELYAGVSDSRPDARVYRVIVEVLDRQLAQRCAQGQGGACARTR